MNTHYRHYRATLLQKDYSLCGVETNKNTVLVGLAVCHPGDATNKADIFSRKVGRENAFENAHLKPIAELTVQEGDSAEYTFYKFASQVLPKQTFHRAVLEFARTEEAMEHGMIIE